MNRRANAWIFVPFLTWLLLGALPALANFRFLYADGAAYLLHIAEHRWFFFPWEGRQAAQFIDQWPAVLAAQAGLRNLRGLGWCLGAGMMLMPALLHAVALFLLMRRGRHQAALLYLAMLWLLTLYAGLMSVAESHVSAALFLLLAVLVFDAPVRSTGSWLAMPVIGTLSLWVYEFWFFYAMVLMLALTIQLRKVFACRPAIVRVLALATLSVLVLSAVINLLRLLGSSDNPNRASFLSMIQGTTLPIYLVLIVGWFVALCLHVVLETVAAQNRRLRWIPGSRCRVCLLVVALAGLIALYAVQHDTMIRYSYPFRVLNLALPVLFAVCLFWIIPPQEREGTFAGGLPILALLTVALLVYETWATLGWRAYQREAARLPAARSHGVYHAQAADSRFMKTWIYPWDHSAQSFLAQALTAGEVRGIAFDPNAGWDPFGPGQEARLQAIAHAYGVRWNP